MWQRFVTAALATIGLGAAAAALFVLLCDPYGVSPLRVISSELIAPGQRRFIVPQIVRNPRFDSFIVGTSTLASIDPQWVSEAFGGSVANVAVHGAMPYEQTRLMALTLRRQPAPRFVLIGLDEVWCSTEAVPQYHPTAVFPEWLYDDGRLAPLAYLLNWRAIDLSKRKLDLALGRSTRGIAANGFHDELPPDSEWTPERARKVAANLAGAGSQRASAGDAASAPLAFPELDRLERVLAAHQPATRLVVLLMPVFQFAKTPPARQQRLDACKVRIARIVAGRQGVTIDLNWPSPLATTPENFWDSEHFRQPIARALPGHVRRAIEQGRGARSDIYRVL